MIYVLIREFALPILLATLGLAVGWWLRGRPGASDGTPGRRKTDRQQQPSRKQLAAHALEGLNAAVEAVRSCVEQHVECIQTIESELRESSGTEPAVISNAADSIVAANGLVRHQFGDVHRMLVSKYDEIHDHLSDPCNLLVTFASLDRQQHVYRKVLRSLETLATELAGNVAGHGQRLQQIDGQLTEDEARCGASVAAAVEQILDAANELEQQVESAETKIVQQAEVVQMQAVLSHTDLLTSLPNRRAFEAELEQCARRSQNKGAYSTIALVNLDRFGQVNTQYGHQGGDVILRQAAGVIKQLMRGKDLVAHYGGDVYAILLHQTTMHDALPVVERVRAALEQTQFSHGSVPLQQTASIGIAQLLPEESASEVTRRAQESLSAAKQTGGNAAYWHDGADSFPISSAFKLAATETNSSPPPLLAMFRRSISGLDMEQPPTERDQARDTPALTGRTLFIANLQRRMAEWKRGGVAVSVIVLRVDQREELVLRFGNHAQEFLQRVLSRLLEAVTRDMDERCELEEGQFAVLLPGLDQSDALAVAERLRSQIRQCKVRMSDALWDLTASIGVAHCSTGSTVVDVMRGAELAMKRAIVEGGDAISASSALAEEIRAALV